MTSRVVSSGARALEPRSRRARRWRSFPCASSGGGTDTGLGRQYDVSRDGRSLINTVLDEAAAPITLIQNWNPEAKP